MSIFYFRILALIIFSLSANAQNKATEYNLPQELEGVSSAEILIRLQHFIATDQRRLMRLQNQSETLNSKINNYSQRFNQLDLNLRNARESGAEKSEVNVVEQQWDYIKKTLDLYLQRRQAVQQQMQVITAKIKKQKEVVDFITLGQVPSATDTLLNIQTEDKKDTTEQVLKIPEIQHRKVLEAIDQLETYEQQLLSAKHSLQLIEHLIRLNRDDLGLSKAMADAVTTQMEIFNQELEKGEERNTDELKRNLREAEASFSQDTSNLETLAMRIEKLEELYIPVAAIVNQVENKVETARERLEFLQSPLAPHRIIYWLKYNLPRIALIIAILIFIWFITRALLGLILNRLKKRRPEEERQERLETLKLASNSMITILVVFIGFLVLLSEMGVDLTVLLGGAAVFSLAIAFGAQSLVKDYFSGFMILLENQYRVGNVVKINNTSGVVEDVTLRMTVLRDLEGIAHFIPHGQITAVSNYTHGWSRISFSIRIGLNEDVNCAMEELITLARQMRDDPEFGPLIIEDPEMLGVDAFAESAIIIKFLVKTKPLKQWMVKRELLRRIKIRFDELGIKIPYPHRIIHYADGNKDYPAIDPD